METERKGLVDVAVNVGGKSNQSDATPSEEEKEKKGLVDVAVNVGGKSFASGKVNIGATDKNKKGLLDISVNIGGKSQDSKEETASGNTDGNHAIADTAPEKSKFAFSLSIFPSMADGLLKIGVDVLRGKSREGRRRHKRHRRNHASNENEQS